MYVVSNNINIKWLLTANAESVKCLRSQLSKSRSASTSHAPLTNELLHTNNSVTRGIPRFAALLIIMLCYVFDCCSFVSLYTTKTHTYVVNNWLIYVDRYHRGSRGNLLYWIYLLANAAIIAQEVDEIRVGILWECRNETTADYLFIDTLLFSNFNKGRDKK